MRQRLGLAHALLGDPEVLILDEPANGLDPEGIRWMRGLLRDFADRGGTVLLSSHLLHEVQAIADRLVIIGNGRIVADGTRDELLAGGACSCGPRTRRARRRAARAGLDVSTPTAAASSRPTPRPSAAPRSKAASSSPSSARPRAPASSSCSSTSRRRRYDRRRPRPRLTRVELRKLGDTRAGFWLLLIDARDQLAAVVIVASPPADRTFADFRHRGAVPDRRVLLPVVAILAVTSGVLAAHGAADVHRGAAAHAGDGRQARRRAWRSA